MSLSGGNVYPACLDRLLAGQLDFTTAAVRAVLVSAHDYDPADAVTGDLAGAVVGAAVDVTVTEIAEGAVTIDALRFPLVTGAHVNAVVFFTDPDAGLVVSITRRADTVPLSITPVGADIAFEPGRLLRL